ncbi:MAG: HIT family protein [Bacteroidota bacterium]|nr:HIT family protein [Bacteroidota bacterium]
MSSIFSKIVNGDIPAHKVAEDDNFLAFFDINPLKKGHTLVIPKKEVDYFFDIDTETYRGLMDFTKRVAKALEPNVECKRLAVVVLGLEVPHAHIHLIPIDKESDVHFSNPRVKMSDEEFKALAEKVNRDFR